MNIKFKIHNLIAAVIALVISCVIVLGQTTFSTAYAATDYSSAVMYELTSDPSFNTDNYPDNAEDYSLQVIQIGEDENKDLYLYCYQPSHNSIDLLGTSVSISYGFSRDGKNLHPKVYDLEQVSTSGVFDKYLVKGFAEDTGSKNDGNRYYNIVTIYRKFNSVVDASVDFGETSEKGYSVGQQWFAYDINNSVAYEMATFETLEVTINLVDNFEFASGIKWGNFAGLNDWCSSWYAAFNVEDYVVQHIYDADVTFDIRTVSESWIMFSGTSYEYGEWERMTLKLTDKDTMSYNGGGLFARTYSWNRIMTSSEYISIAKEQHVNINADIENTIKQSQWVFAFHETQIDMITGDGMYVTHYSELGNVDNGGLGFAILRLHFMDVNHKVYDLGVVSDKITPDNVAGGYGSIKSIEEILQDLGGIMEKIFMIIGIILLVVIFIALCSLCDGVKNFFKFMGSAIAFIFTAPIRLFKWIFKKDSR